MLPWGALLRIYIYIYKVKPPNFNEKIIIIATILFCGNNDKYRDQPNEYFKDEIVITEQLKFNEKLLQNNKKKSNYF